MAEVLCCFPELTGLKLGREPCINLLWRVHISLDIPPYPPSIATRQLFDVTRLCTCSSSNNYLIEVAHCTPVYSHSLPALRMQVSNYMEQSPCLEVNSPSALCYYHETRRNPLYIPSDWRLMKPYNFLSSDVECVLVHTAGLSCARQKMTSGRSVHGSPSSLIYLVETGELVLPEGGGALELFAVPSRKMCNLSRTTFGVESPSADLYLLVSSDSARSIN
jgi:hypothetical protein